MENNLDPKIRYTERIYFFVSVSLHRNTGINICLVNSLHRKGRKHLPTSVFKNWSRAKKDSETADINQGYVNCKFIFQFGSSP